MIKTTKTSRNVTGAVIFAAASAVAMPASASYLSFDYSDWLNGVIQSPMSVSTSRRNNHHSDKP